MRFAAAILLVGAALALEARPAQALFRGYSEAWCLISYDGMQDCAYYTFAQCRAAASGNGNFCHHNPRYVPQKKSRATRKLKSPYSR